MHVVECDPDVLLVSALASLSSRRIVHAGGKSQVLKKLIRKYTDSVGMIDQDPYSPQPRNFLQRFRQVHYLRGDKIKILHHNRRNNRLIILCPRLEEWIVEAAREANIRLSTYNLPNNPVQLHAIINLRINRFQQLVEDLRHRSNRVRALQTFL